MKCWLIGLDFDFIANCAFNKPVDLLDQFLRVELGKVGNLDGIEVAAISKVIGVNMLASGDGDDVVAASDLRDGN